MLHKPTMRLFKGVLTSCQSITSVYQIQTINSLSTTTVRHSTKICCQLSGASGQSSRAFKMASNLAGSGTKDNVSGDGTSKRKDHAELTASNFRQIEEQSAVVQRVTNLSPTVKGITLVVEDISRIKDCFKAGQWLDLFIPNVEQVGGFSMCNSPDSFTKSGAVELAVKKSSWPPANWVHTKCQEGDEVSFRFGGDFHYPPKSMDSSEPHSLLLLAGGVGINPLISIWLHSRSLTSSAQSQMAPKKVHLMYSAVTKDELIFRDILDCTAKELNNFSVEYFVTREDNGKRMNSEQIGKALEDLSLTEGTNGRKPRLLVYLCGPPGMIRFLETELASRGVPAQDMFFELWY